MMWICPKCKREYAKMNQSHFCTQKPETVDDYISMFDEETAEQLRLVRDTLRQALPQAHEKISWSMPTYWNQHNIIHFAAAKKHIGLYPGAEAVKHFSPKLDVLGYRYSKGSIQIPYGDELPCDLIEEIARWCEETGNHA